jgi:DNA polymerase III delta prime subunit
LLCDFLKLDVFQKGNIGWLLGPPGVGKSLSALAFATTIDRETWTIIWLSLYRTGAPTVWVIENNLKKSISLKTGSKDFFNDVMTVLNSFDKKEQKVLFIDDYIESRHEKILSVAIDWLKSKRDVHKLIVTCSMRQEYKQPNDADFYVDSWQREEYLSATEIPELRTKLASSLPDLRSHD